MLITAAWYLNNSSGMKTVQLYPRIPPCRRLPWTLHYLRFFIRPAFFSGAEHSNKCCVLNGNSGLDIRCMLARSYVRYLSIATTSFMFISLSAMMIPLLRFNNLPAVVHAGFCSPDASATEGLNADSGHIGVNGMTVRNQIFSSFQFLLS